MICGTGIFLGAGAKFKPLERTDFSVSLSSLEDRFTTHLSEVSLDRPVLWHLPSSGQTFPYGFSYQLPSLGLACGSLLLEFYWMPLTSGFNRELNRDMTFALYSLLQ